MMWRIVSLRFQHASTKSIVAVQGSKLIHSAYLSKALTAQYCMQSFSQVAGLSRRSLAILAIAGLVFISFPARVAFAAFPTVSSITSSTFGVDDNNHLVGMPAVVDAGDLLIVLFANDDSDSVTTPSGWTLLFSQHETTNNRVRGSVYAKDAVGDEDGTTVDFVTSGNEQAAAQVYRIPASNWYGTIATGIEVGSANENETGTSPDPSPLNPSNWGSEDTLWITFLATSCCIGGVANAPTYPSG